MNWDAIAIALINKLPAILTALGTIVAAICSIAAAWLARNTHRAVNSRMTEMLKLASALARRCCTSRIQRGMGAQND